MNHASSKRISVVPVVIFFTGAISAVILMLGSLTLNSGTPQKVSPRERVVNKAYSHNPQVDIVEVKAGLKALRIGEKFDAGDDWIKTLAWKIRNTSGKPIVYLKVNINFPETKTTGNMMSFPVEFGQRPGSKFRQRSESLLLNPEDTLDITLDTHYDRVKNFVELRHPIKDIHEAEIEIGFIIFSDTSAWAAGSFYQQDPNDPDHYINVGDRPRQNFKQR